MPEENGGDRGLTPQIEAQVSYIKDQFERNRKPPFDVETEDGGVGFMYAKGQLLVRDAYLDEVRRILGQPQDEEDAGAVERVITGVVLLRLRSTPVNQEASVLVALERIDAALGRGVATPNHVLTVAPEAGPCPATEPERAYERTEPFPGLCRSNSGAGVLVYVADTGLLAEYMDDAGLRAGAPDVCPWLRGVKGRPDDPLGYTADGQPAIPPYVGHGTFVAGVVRSVAPEAEIFVTNAFKVAGSTYESDLVKDLGAALSYPVDIFHLSITSTTRYNLTLIGIESWLEQLRRYKGAVCVVAAGNNGSTRRCWPAAAWGTVSVGALGTDWRGRARFSNYGSWVDVYAPGRDLVNAFATGTYTCQYPPYAGDVRQFYGMATWSGTSFSTPIVTGLIADRISRTGENGQEAATALLAQARRQAIPGVGAILVPCRGCACSDGCSRCHPAESARACPCS